ncbi:vesicular glutamate transporter 1 [Homalodisca vitripennis]|uniref:vesicular glutamate transporter 1 n=1 Tax=Homalodisca vitripennis TaxID=197043 RepID=UPI001EE9B142|nr:vesicular glutamate transporter 1 [Homalodisca vitripennis]XP_046664365.1 vesicular glutamate transporter 1 [Homalodisca vitripennis]
MPGLDALGALSVLKDKASGIFRSNVRYEEFEMPHKNLQDVQPTLGYAKGEGLPRSPESPPEPERPPLRHIDKYIAPECPCLSKRYTIAMLTCAGFIISFGMRCNMGMAKLKIFGEPTKTHHHGNHSHPDEPKEDDDEVHFNWSVGMESAVDSSFFWGYLVTQVPGGFLASKYPANRVFGTAIACSSFLNLLVPGATMLHPMAVILVRVLQGLVEGVTYPACHGIWRYWAPPLERSRLATIAFCGSYAGVVVGMPLSGMLIASFSWQAPFYFYGVVGLLWYLVWLWLSFERPSKHPTISGRELMYIEQSIGTTTQAALPTIATTPWRAFFTSMPVYAIIVANFCRSWNFYLLVLFQASYLLHNFHLQIEETGFIGALPHLLMTVIVPCGGLLADHIRKKGIMSTTNVRKIFNCGGFGMEAVFFIVVAYARSAFTATLALTFGVAFSGFAISGFNVNHLDIAPRYASILMGMSNGIGTIAGLICPIAIDYITYNQTHESWKHVFLLAATVHFIGVTFYAIYASGELQPWAEPESEEKKPWDPLEGAKPQWDPMESAITSPPEKLPPTNPFAQPAPTNPFKAQMLNYGSMDQGPGGQFGYSNHIMTEAVQPESKDSYMHDPQAY